MRRSLKNIFVLAILLCCGYTGHAQQNSVQLPSLITNQESKDAHADAFSIEGILKRSMFVKVIASKTKIFVGEPVMAIYKFYTAVSGQAVVTKQPEFVGWSVRELNYEDDPQVEMIDGEEYRTYIIRKVQLTPLEPGVLSLGVASVSNYIELPKAGDPFATDKYNILVSNPSASVQVIPLPHKNKPAGFYGITGIFKIAASALNNKVPVGENGHLIVTIKGSGNLDAINKPEVVWPGNTEHFDGNDSQHINQDNFPISGDRTFDIPFVGRHEGTILIPPISFSFFNTSLKNYQTITTDSIAITFTKPLEKNGAFADIVDYDMTNRRYLWIVGAIAVTVSLVGFVSYRRGKTQLKNKLIPEPQIVAAPEFIMPSSVPEIKYRTDFSRHWGDLQGIADTKVFFAKAKDLLSRAVAERVDTIQHPEEVLLAELKQQTSTILFKQVSMYFEACNVNLYAPFETHVDLNYYFVELKNITEQLQAES